MTDFGTSAVEPSATTISISQIHSRLFNITISTTFERGKVIMNDG